MNGLGDRRWDKFFFTPAKNAGKSFPVHLIRGVIVTIIIYVMSAKKRRMKMFDEKKVLNETAMKCAHEIEMLEKEVGRVLTQFESLAFQAGYMLGHAEGQRFAIRVFSGTVSPSK